MPIWGLAAFSWILSLYFLACFIWRVGFPPDRALLAADSVYVFLWLFFLFLPYFQKVKIAGVVELEREVAKAKEELSEFKAEVRNTISVLSTNVNTVGNTSNHFNISMSAPDLQLLEKARQQVELAASAAAKQEVKQAQEVQQGLSGDGEGTAMALVRTRIEIERLLRKILGKTTVGFTADENTKFLGLRRLFDLFLDARKNYEYLKQPFQYVLQVCNAATHAQSVSPAQAKEALVLGAHIISALTLETRKL